MDPVLERPVASPAVLKLSTLLECCSLERPCPEPLRDTGRLGSEGGLGGSTWASKSPTDGGLGI